MSRLETIQAFIDQSKVLDSPKALLTLVDDVGREMGFDYAALIDHVDLSGYTSSLRHMETGVIVAASTYPSALEEMYLAENMVTNDPVLLASHQTNMGFSWEEIPDLIRMTDAHRLIREKARRAGVEHGFTVPANVPGQVNGSCNFAMATGRALPTANLKMAQLVGGFAFQAARRMVINARPDLMIPEPAPLTARQIECTLLWARGKKGSEIAIMLGITEGTVRRHLEAVREHYDVVSMQQVHNRAMYDGYYGVIDTLK